MTVKVKRFTDAVGVQQIVRYGLFVVGAALMSYSAYQIGAQDGVRVTQEFVVNNIDPETYKRLNDAYKKH